MTFLEARRIASTAVGKEPWPLLLALSGMPDPLLVYVIAHAAANNRHALVRTLPFGTLRQAMLSSGSTVERQAYLMCPWDFAPVLDWRSGLPAGSVGVEEVKAEADEFAALLGKRIDKACVYLAAPIPPLFSRPEDSLEVSAYIALLAQRSAARLVKAEGFSLASYVSSGCPIRSTHLSEVAGDIVDALLDKDGPAKLLVTDLDDTLWAGIVGDLGPDGIEYRPEGRGYRHHLYQSMLRSLKDAGALLAIVSRNDAEAVSEAFVRSEMVLREDDFVAAIVSYEPKSAQIRALAEQLNLDLDSVVFVDDNLVELAEVSAALPQTRCLRFPDHEDGMVGFTEELRRLFRRNRATHEDRQRTAMYRRRLASMVPRQSDGACILEFLRGLDMRLTISDRSRRERTRAVQLINKTNQFNVNGRRWSETEIDEVLAQGGHLFGAALEDRTGAHGEILSLLIDRERVVRALVLSCRVLQRRVEFAFLHWLSEAFPNGDIVIEYAKTAKNAPAREFLEDAAFATSAAGLIHVDRHRLEALHRTDREVVHIAALHD